jgi:hypothetical protein
MRSSNMERPSSPAPSTDTEGRRVSWRWFFAVALIVGFAACSASETRDVTGPVDTTGNGNVQRATLTVTVDLTVPAQPVASTLGWSAGVPGATVQATRTGSTATETATTDDQGVASFQDLLPGNYQITAVRTLSVGELAQLDGAGVRIDALGGGQALTVTAPSSAYTVQLSGGSRGSLVLSEVSHSLIRDPAAGDYYSGQFFEVYNNSDTIIYLDGKTLFTGLRGWHDIPDPNFGCAYYDPYNYDSLGIWSDRTYRFPGAGTDYPLAPGEVAVLATDAIDHSTIVNGGLNLTSADFEFRGSADVNNPGVPDMLSIGTADGGILGNGLIMFNTREVLALADHVDPSTLTTAQIFATNIPHKRIPGALILDVVTLHRNIADQYPDCGESSVHPSFDRQDAKLLTRYDPNTAQRRVLFTAPSGRKVLQRTGTSSVDLQAGQPTPGSIP